MMRLSLSFAALLTCTCLASQAADLSDMRTGTFHGIWCGYQAEFRVRSKEQGEWIFHGHVFFPEYDAQDELWIEQYSDQSLRMTRTLGQGSGATGKKQMAQTLPPKLNNSDNGAYALYQSEFTGGIDCEGRRTRMLVPKG